MTYFIKVADKWVEFTGQAIDGIQWPQGFQHGREPEELEPMGVFQAAKPTIPDGKLIDTIQVVDDAGRPKYEVTFKDKPALTPSDCPITMRQLRLGLRHFGGKRANYIQSLIDSIQMEVTQDAAQIWYDETDEVLWDNEMTQTLMSMTDFTLEQAAEMWMAAYNTLPR